MSKSSESVGVAVTENHGTGAWNSRVYHTREDCPQIKNAEPGNLKPLPESERDRYNMRECTDCQRLKTEEFLTE